MPKWFNHKLQIIGNANDIANFKKIAARPVPNESPSPLNFHNFVPVPESMAETDKSLRDIKFGVSADEWERRERRDQWEHSQWGCKWGAVRAQVRQENDLMLFYDFDTRHYPASYFWEQVAKLHPGLTFILTSDNISVQIFRFIFKNNVPQFEDRFWLLEARMGGQGLNPTEKELENLR